MAEGFVTVAETPLFVRQAAKICCVTRPLYLLLVYAKADKGDLSPDEKRKVRRLAETLKADRRRKRN